jgi:hypothetical protein
VARGNRRPGSDRGGEGIQALRARPALSWGAGAVLLAALLAALPALSDPALGAIGIAALFVLVVGLSLGRPAAVPWAIAGLGAEYAASLGGDGLDRRVPLYAVGLLVTAELAFWALQLRRGAPDEPGMAERRIIGLLLAATAALLAGSLLVVVARLPLRGGLGIEALGLAAAIGALALLVVAARRPTGE